MYAIYVNNKRYNTKNFTSYEAARSWARKLIRQGRFNPIRFGFDWSDVDYRNPSINHYGVTIKAV
jgi:hypothetical protein